MLQHLALELDVKQFLVPHLKQRDWKNDLIYETEVRAVFSVDGFEKRLTDAERESMALDKGWINNESITTTGVGVVAAIGSSIVLIKILYGHYDRSDVLDDETHSDHPGFNDESASQDDGVSVLFFTDREQIVYWVLRFVVGASVLVILMIVFVLCRKSKPKPREGYTEGEEEVETEDSFSEVRKPHRDDAIEDEMPTYRRMELDVKVPRTPEEIREQQMRWSRQRHQEYLAIKAAEERLKHGRQAQAAAAAPDESRLTQLQRALDDEMEKYVEEQREKRTRDADLFAMMLQHDAGHARRQVREEKKKCRKKRESAQFDC